MTESKENINIRLIGQVSTFFDGVGMEDHLYCRYDPQFLQPVSVDGPTNKIIAFASTLPIGYDIPLNSAPESHRNVVFLMVSSWIT